MPNGKIFAAEFALRRNVSALDKLLIEDSEDGVVKYAYPPQVSALSGYAYAESIADLPDNPANKTIAYVVGRMLYIYVGEGGDAKNGEYQSVDFLVGPPGIPGEKGDKGDPADGSIDEAYLANYLQQNQYQTAADVNSKLALYATKQYVKDEINELLGGASSAFDTLKEIEDVLAGNVDSIGDLFAVLDTKWTQDNTLIAHWNEAYSWGNHALAGYLTQADASDFVTVTEAQTITGAKNFTGGLQVNGSAIVYNSALGVWQLTGDLLVTGGISMYSSIEGFVPSTITDAVLIDNQTIKRNSVGALYAVAAGLDESQLAAYLTTNNYAKKSDITTALVPYALATSIPTNNNQLTNGAGYITASALNDYATQTLVNTALSSYFLSDNFTKANIKSTLGISDWALASAKPTYTASEVGALGVSKELNSGSLNDYTTAGIYHFNAISDASAEMAKYGNLLVVRGGPYDTLTQLYFNYYDGKAFIRSSNLRGLPSANWNRVAFASDIPTALSQLTDDVVAGKYLSLSGGTVNGSITATSFIGNLTGNADSATKLATPRTIWGQSFDGTGNVVGDLILQSATNVSSNGDSAILRFNGANYANGDIVTGPSIRAIYDSYYGRKRLAIFQHNANDYTTESEVFSILPNGNVAIGGTAAEAKLHVHGNILATGNISANEGFNSFNTPINTRPNALSSGINVLRGNYADAGMENADISFWWTALDIGYANKAGTSSDAGYRSQILVPNTKYHNRLFLRRGGDTNWLSIIEFAFTNSDSFSPASGTLTVNGNVAIGGTTANAKLHVYGNLLTEGGITMYSQRSLKNILSYEGLSLEQLSVIKPIKFTWKDGRDNRYHVGGVADDVATVVPEVVYSANDFLTMDYGNAGFYVAASLIKPVIDHEQRIKQLEQENKALRKEINQLRQSA